MTGFGGLDEELRGEGQEFGEQEDHGRKIEPFSKKRRPFHFWEVDGRDYKLKLTTAMIGKLENKYRMNILNLVSTDGIPPLSVMLTIIQAAMDPWEHGMTYAKVQEIYEKWTENGGNQMEFFSDILMPTMAVSGFFTEKQAEAMMERMKGMDELL